METASNYWRWLSVCSRKAAHVVSSADEWKQPIKLTHGTNQIYLDDPARVIFMSWETDSAVILFKNDLSLPQHPIPLFPATRDMFIGSEIGWLGFPAIARNAACFFSGNISAIEHAPKKAYLIDGVAINGVSGGPVVYFDHDDLELKVIGIISAYRANRSTGDTLPGLSIAQDVSHFHGVIKHIETVDEARRKKTQFDTTGQPQAEESAGQPTE